MQIRRNNLESTQFVKKITVMHSLYYLSQEVEHSACYMPGADDDRPLVGKVPGLTGLYVAAGHYCWGILQEYGGSQTYENLTRQMGHIVMLYIYNNFTFTRTYRDLKSESYIFNYDYF